MRYITLCLIIGTFAFSGGCASTQTHVDNNSSIAQISIGAPLQTDSAGETAEVAQQGVTRVICRTTSFGGTGFLHKSGVVITAAHVIAGCTLPDLVIVTASGLQIGVASASADDVKDIAILRPTLTVPGSPLTIASVSEPRLGTQVITWGYPGGYDGPYPLLSVGYFAGVQDFNVWGDRKIRRWVINAAFNGGNSGGPLLSVENGQVIGLVTSKLAPLPKVIAAIIENLKNDKAGVYSGTIINGQSVSQAQLAGYVLEYLRTQVQLVIGYCVTAKDLNDFLKAQDVTP
jgi:S1-C subfamily serine protease